MARAQWIHQSLAGRAWEAARTALELELDRLQRFLILPEPIITLRFGATVTPDLRGQANAKCALTVPNNSAFTIAAPINAEDGAETWFDILNSSGGAMGAVTWAAAYKFDAAWASPNNGAHRVVGFFRSGAAWVQMANSLDTGGGGGGVAIDDASHVVAHSMLLPRSAPLPPEPVNDAGRIIANRFFGD